MKINYIPKTGQLGAPNKNVNGEFMLYKVSNRDKRSERNQFPIEAKKKKTHQRHEETVNKGISFHAKEINPGGDSFREYNDL